MMVIHELMVCNDCIMLIANNDPTGIDERDFTRVTKAVKALQPNTHAGDSDKHVDFSWRNCECCNALAGERHHVVVLGSGEETNDQT